MLSFLKEHERLIITLVLGGLLFWSYTKYLHYADARDLRNMTAAQLVVKQDTVKNAETAQQLQQMVKDNQTFAASVLANEQQLLATISQRNAAATKQQAADLTLPPPEVASRWQSLLQLPPLSVQPSSGGYSVADSAARTTVQQLELVPVLQSDLKDETVIAAGKDKEIVKLNGIVSTSQGETAGLQKTLKDADKACDAKIQVVKDDARKKRKWYVILGAVLGELGRRALTGGF